MEKTDDKPAEDAQVTTGTSASRSRAGVPKLVVIALLFSGLASAMVISPAVRLVEEPGMAKVFPEQVNGWEGETLYFCQAKTCGRPCLESERNTETPDRCPSCTDGELNSGAYAERAQLPDDTYIHKKRYLDPDGNMVQAAVVLSGAHRSSIHRPEVCLEGGSTSVVGQEMMDVALESGEVLPVKVLRLARPVPLGNGEMAIQESWYAYFFVGDGRVTASHYERMWTMAKDRVFRNRTYRWAYIGLSGVWKEGEDPKPLIRSFAADLFPQMDVGRAEP